MFKSKYITNIFLGLEDDWNLLGIDSIGFHH